MKKIKIIFQKVKNFITKVSRQKFLAHSLFGAALLFILLTVVIPTNPVYGMIVKNNDYKLVNFPITATRGKLEENLYITDAATENQLSFENLSLDNWNYQTDCITIAFLQFSLGYTGGNIPELALLGIEGNNSHYLILANNQISEQVVLNGTSQIDITLDVVNDTFCGFLLNIQFDLDTTNTIKTQWWTVQTVNWINDSWEIRSYPFYYFEQEFQGLSVIYQNILDNLSIKDYSHYVSFNAVAYEHLGSNLLDTSGSSPKPINNAKVWNDNALEILDYLSQTVGLPQRGYNNIELMEESYNNGFYSGKELGYKQGYNEGLSVGENATTNWIATISKGIGNVLSMEIAPNLPLGLLVAIPLVMGMIGLIFMFWRKD